METLCRNIAPSFKNKPPGLVFLWRVFFEFIQHAFKIFAFGEKSDDDHDLQRCDGANSRLVTDVISLNIVVRGVLIISAASNSIVWPNCSFIK